MSFWLDIRLDFRHVWTKPTYPINNFFIFFIFFYFFESVSLYTAIISETICQREKKNILRNSSSEKNFCAFI